MQLKIVARSVAIIVILVGMAGCKRNREVSDTLAWMNNTYNPSKGTSRDGGHGEMAFYVKQFGKQTLFFRRTESFTYDGCQMTLHTKDDPSSQVGQVSYIDSSLRFNLGDIDPQSLKMNTYDPRYAGNSCESFDPDTIANMQCSVAQLDFLTHSEAPLIDKQSHTTFPNTEGSGHETNETGKDRKAYFVFDDSEYARRFAKAFRHAIEVCGGKPEPF